jgi:hypothetical protein
MPDQLRNTHHPRITATAASAFLSKKSPNGPGFIYRNAAEAIECTSMRAL